MKNPKKPVTDKVRLSLFAGARPNFVKAAALMRALSKDGSFETRLIHSGQHYDPQLSQVFFDELEIPNPDKHLEAGSGSHAQQTAKILSESEKYFFEERKAGREPDAAIVIGDVNTAVAGALAATKLGIPVVHVEAGLRSRDRTMPEEINRILADHIAQVHLCSEPSGVENLKREGIRESVHLSGNLMIDTLLQWREKAQSRPILKELGLKSRGFGLVTLHRPANVDDPTALRNILSTFETVAKSVPLVFSVHPRTAEQMKKNKLESDRIRVLKPLGYLDFLSLMSQCALVLTDSGGIQEETTALGIPCLVLRENTERPITVEEGTGTLVGNDRAKVLTHVEKVLAGTYRKGKCPRIWDGRAGERMAETLKNVFLKAPSKEKKAA